MPFGLPHCFFAENDPSDSLSGVGGIGQDDRYGRLLSIRGFRNVHCDHVVEHAGIGRKGPSLPLGFPRASRRWSALWSCLPIFAVSIGLTGCAGSSRTVTLEQIEELRTMEALLPMTADSVISRYRRYDPALFYATFGNLIQGATAAMDSLNQPLPAGLRLDTLAIDHTFEGLGEAARRGRTLYISSSYFYLYESLPVIRSVIWHEFGHVHFALLNGDQVGKLRKIWDESRVSALFFVFRDGEYSENARFGGHPEESLEELYASAFNLFSNRPDEVEFRAGFVSAKGRELVSRLRDLVRESMNQR